MKDDRGQDGESAEDKESLVDAADHRDRVCAQAAGNEEGRGKAGRSDTEADRHLLHGAGDGTGGAGLLIVDIGINQRVHAGILQGGEGAVTEGCSTITQSGVRAPTVANNISRRPRMVVFEISTLR